MARPLRVLDLGHMPYGRALEIQHRLVDDRSAERIPDTLALVEHPPVITMGRSAHESDILATPEQLNAAGATVHRITRGGEVTYHGPGQVVGYPIVNLYEHERKIRLFVERLEETIIQVLGRYWGIAASRDAAHRGVWVDDAKIAAIGISITRKITMHGFAFNVNTDLSHFGWIIPCGIQDKGVTSLATLVGRPVDMDTVGEQVLACFTEIYDYQIIAREQWS